MKLGVNEARATLTHQTPTCTPIILDGLAVKCVMWGSVNVECEGRLVVYGGCLRAHHHPTPTSITYTPSFLMAAYLYLQY